MVSSLSVHAGCIPTGVKLLPFPMHHMHSHTHVRRYSPYLMARHWPLWCFYRQPTSSKPRHCHCAGAQWSSSLHAMRVIVHRPNNYSSIHQQTTNAINRGNGSAPAHCCQSIKVGRRWQQQWPTTKHYPAQQYSSSRPLVGVKHTVY